MSPLSRRELLVSLLGLPALAGCAERGTGELKFPGQLVGAADDFGHRLRGGGAVPRPADDAWTDVSVAIVGGGVSGLAAARRLLMAGREDFVLLELEAAPGGTARGGSTGGLAHPWGAHYLPLPMADNAPLVELLEELGVLDGRDAAGQPVAAEECLVREPEERLFYKGRWYEDLFLHAGASAEDRRQLAAFQAEIDRWVAWRDGQGRRAFAVPVSAASDDPAVTELDRLSMADWLAQRGFDSPRLLWWIDYGCRDDYGLRLADTSAWAALFYFAARVREPGQPSQPLLTWPDGNARIVRHLAGLASKQLRPGLLAAEIVPAASPVGRVEVIALDRQGRPQGFRAQRVIFAAGQFVAGRVLRPWREQPPAHLADFDYGAWMVANLSLGSRPAERGFPLCWDNVLYESPALGYVVATHQRGIDHGPTVFTYYYPLCDADGRTARTRLAGLGWRDWAETAIADLSRAHADLPSLVTQLDVMRWGHAMIRPRPGLVWGRSRAAARQPLGGIHFAHSDLSGLPLFEEAFDQGERAAREALAELRRG